MWNFYTVLLQTHSGNCLRKKWHTRQTSAWSSYCKMNKGAIIFASQCIIIYKLWNVCVPYFADLMSFWQELDKSAIENMLVLRHTELRPDCLGNSRHIWRYQNGQEIGQVDSNACDGSSTDATTPHHIRYSNWLYTHYETSYSHRGFLCQTIETIQRYNLQKQWEGLSYNTRS